MFDVVAGRRRRSVWTPRSVAVSIAAHLLLLVGAFLPAAESRLPSQAPIELPVMVSPPAATKAVARPRRPVTPPPAPVQPRLAGVDATPAPDDVPDAIPSEIPQYSRSELRGNGFGGEDSGLPSPDARPAAGNADPGSDDCDGGPCPSDVVTVLPRLGNAREAERLLHHLYPPLLRDAGITGRTIVVLIIDREGNVLPGSVRVQEATHPGFTDAAIRAAEKMRFTPARLNGRTVSVVIAIPIDWQLEN